MRTSPLHTAIAAAARALPDNVLAQLALDAGFQITITAPARAEPAPRVRRGRGPALATEGDLVRLDALVTGASAALSLADAAAQTHLPPSRARRLLDQLVAGESIFAAGRGAARRYAATQVGAAAALAYNVQREQA